MCVVSVLYTTCTYRKVTEGLWKGQDDICSQSAKRTEDTGKNSDLDILTSPPLSLNDLGGSASLANWMPISGSDPDTSGPEQDPHPTASYRSRVLDELPSRRGADKSVSVEVRLVRNIPPGVYSYKLLLTLLNVHIYRGICTFTSVTIFWKVYRCIVYV